jgi:phage anti-repressor protein
MNQIIAPKTINFNDLVKNSNTTLSLTLQTKMTLILNKEFTEEQQQWYIANLFMYMNYHPTNDYPINLEHVFKMIGFANKENAKRTLKNNFTLNEDYKKLLVRTDEQVPNIKDGKNIGGAGLNNETVMLNIDTFKNLCMFAKTQQGKEIRKYYVKLENIYNKIIKEEIENKDKLLEENKKLLEEQKEKIEMLESKPETEGFFRESGYIYIIKETSKLGRYKIGKSKNPIDRISGLNVSSSETSLLIDRQFETVDMESAEKTIQLMLKPYRIKKRAEWFFFKDEIELENAINTIVKCLEFIKQYRDNHRFVDINKEEKEQEIENEISEKEKIGLYNGVFWEKKRNKWRSELVKDYKSYFLGYHNTELDGAKAYNDYASYLNINYNTNYILNKIDNYTPNPRNIPDDNKNLVLEKKSSKYIGVHYDNTRQHFVVSMRFKLKHINLGNHTDEVECAKMYNQQALYFNNNYDTNYTLNDIENYVTIEKNIYNELKSSLVENKSSVYVGVVKRKNGRFNSQIILNKKIIRLGIFENEIDAAKAYNEKAKEFNIKYNKNYKVNIFN